MGRTVDEIERRMRPEYLGRQAQEAIRTSASQASNRMLETLSENPVPSLIAGLSIGWLIANGRRSNGHPPGDRAAHFDNPTEAGHRERTAQKDTNGSDQSSISDQAREKAEEAGKTAQHYGEEAWHSAEETTRGAKRQARRGIGQAERMIKENPLGAGIVSLAVGAFAGLMVPGTRREDELMGETRDEVVDKAKETARETTDRAKDVAKKTAE